MHKLAVGRWIVLAPEVIDSALDIGDTLKFLSKHDK